MPAGVRRGGPRTRNWQVAVRLAVGAMAGACASSPPTRTDSEPPLWQLSTELALRSKECAASGSESDKLAVRELARQYARRSGRTELIILQQPNVAVCLHPGAVRPGADIEPSTDPQDLSGRWLGVMMREDREGEVEIVIRSEGGRYEAAYYGLPSLSGKLYVHESGPGTQPNTTTLMMTSRESNEGGVLEFYLAKEHGKLQLHGVIVLTAPGMKEQFRTVLERQPCCAPGCIHPGRSSCSP